MDFQLSFLAGKCCAVKPQWEPIRANHATSQVWSLDLVRQFTFQCGMGRPGMVRSVEEWAAIEEHKHTQNSQKNDLQ